MISMKMPRDVRKYETKLVGPLTLRQLICSLLGVGLAVLVNISIVPHIPRELGNFLTMASVIPFGLIGWYKPYGLHFEEFFLQWLYSFILSSSKRKWSNKTAYESIVEKIESQKTKKEKKTESKAQKTCNKHAKNSKKKKGEK